MILDEYSLNFMLDEFIRQLEFFDVPLYHQDLPYIVVKYAFDKESAARTALEKLLVALVRRELITQAQLASGIKKVYDHVDDIVIDVPQARTLLHETVQFLVGSGVLSPSVEKEIDEANELLADHAAVQTIKDHYEDLIANFFDDGHVEVAAEELAEVHTVYFAHQAEAFATALQFEFVKKLINHAMDRGNR